MKWLRLYSSVLHDPKVQRLSPALFKHWVNLLCLASEQEQRGLLPSVDDIAFTLRIKPSEAANVMKLLRCAGLIDTTEDGRDYPHNWPQRQRESDDVAARVRRHRAASPPSPGRESATTTQDDAEPKARKPRKQAHSTPKDNDNVTLQVTLHETAGNTLDTDTDTDTDTDKREGEPLARPRTPTPISKAVAPEKPANRPAEPKTRPTNPLWDVLVEVFYEPTTKDERKLFGKIVHDLKEVGATPDDVRARVRQHGKTQSHWDLTPRALVTHWSQLGTEVSKNGTAESARRDAAQREAALEDERARNAAAMVHDLAQLRTGG